MALTPQCCQALSSTRKSLGTRLRIDSQRDVHVGTKKNVSPFRCLLSLEYSNLSKKKAQPWKKRPTPFSMKLLLFYRPTPLFWMLLLFSFEKVCPSIYGSNHSVFLLHLHVLTLLHVVAGTPALERLVGCWTEHHKFEQKDTVIVPL